MPTRSGLWTALLLIALGTAAIGVAWTGLGPQTDDTYQYTAYEIDHDGAAYGTDADALVLTNQYTGTELTSPGSANVDDRIACLPYEEFACSLIAAQFDDPRELPWSRTGQYEYAHFDTGFYAIEPPYNGGTGEFEHVDGATVFEELALDESDLTRLERRALEDGRVLTTRQFPNANRIVEHDGAYYTLLVTGQRFESGMCSWSGTDDFCEEAGRHRTFHRALQLGLGVLGALGVTVGGWRLVAVGRGRRAPDGDERT